MINSIEELLEKPDKKLMYPAYIVYADNQEIRIRCYGLKMLYKTLSVLFQKGYKDIEIVVKEYD